MSDPFIGEIRLVGFSFEPRGWAFCNGQLMSISQNSALFALLGTTFGGDGVTTFGLPDLRGRSPVGMGSGPGLSSITQGEESGSENTSLTVSQLPVHAPVAQFVGQPSNASASVSIDVGTDVSAPMVPPTQGSTAYLSAMTAKSGISNVAINGLYTGTAPGSTKANLGGINSQVTVTPVGTVTVNPVGGGLPVGLRNPYLGSNFVIALEGIFPSRN
jgi:microcystin-dependent protein